MRNMVSINACACVIDMNRPRGLSRSETQILLHSDPDTNTQPHGHPHLQSYYTDTYTQTEKMTQIESNSKTDTLTQAFRPIL